MEYQQLKIPIQARPDGGTLLLHAYRFNSGLDGPKIYLQGNLHGPEIFGTTLLLRLIRDLTTWKEIPGTLTIVPCANPMSIQDVGYNTQLGRWNAIDGTNWNRIFPITQGLQWSHTDEEEAFYSNLLQQNNLTIQQRLAGELRLLSAGSHYIVDIHTTGTENMEHIFTLKSSSTKFDGLCAKYHLVQDGEFAGETFEESHSYPYRESADVNRAACTWETSHHGKIEAADVVDRLGKLMNWLHITWGFEAKIPATEPIILKNCEHLVTPEGGYYVWTKQIGSTLKKGETYAEIYHPESPSTHLAKAHRDMHLIAKYGTGAIGAGEQIGWVGY